MRGVLITFEGVEGSGKSTQAERLKRWLDGQGIACLRSREPGGTLIGERIRDILLDPACRMMDGWTELFLYLASRSQHVRELVMPALREGKVVILDRFADSSVAYQGSGRQLGARPVSRLNKLAVSSVRPDLTFVVDVPVEVGQERKKAAVLDRLEQEAVQFHLRVRDGYLRLARRAPRRVKLLDGALLPDEIEAAVRTCTSGLLKRKGFVLK
jgi:dTMP kinase